MFQLFFFFYFSPVSPVSPCDPCVPCVSCIPLFPCVRCLSPVWQFQSKETRPSKYKVLWLSENFQTCGPADLLCLFSHTAQISLPRMLGWIASRRFHESKIWSMTIIDGPSLVDHHWWCLNYPVESKWLKIDHLQFRNRTLNVSKIHLAPEKESRTLVPPDISSP